MLTAELKGLHSPLLTHVAQLTADMSGSPGKGGRCARGGVVFVTVDTYSRARVPQKKKNAKTREHFF